MPTPQVTITIKLTKSGPTTLYIGGLPPRPGTPGGGAGAVQRGMARTYGMAKPYAMPFHVLEREILGWLGSVNGETLEIQNATGEDPIRFSAFLATSSG